MSTILLQGMNSVKLITQGYGSAPSTPLAAATPRSGYAQKPETTMPIVIISPSGEMTLGVPISKDKRIVLNLSFEEEESE